MKDRINFKKVKKVQDGFLADGMFIHKINSNRHYEILKEWIEKGGLLEKELTLDKLRIQKILNIICLLHFLTKNYKVDSKILLRAYFF